MRNFLLFLLNVVCLTTAFSQAVQTAKRVYTRSSLTEPFSKIKSQELSIYDKKTCQDTVINAFYDSYYPANVYRTATVTNKKYDTQKRLLEKVLTSTYLEKKNTTTDTLVKTGTRNERWRYVYSVKADTIVYDKYDTLTKKWVLFSNNILRKPGFGADTIKTATSLTIFDTKGRLVLDKYMNAQGITTDSTVNKFDNLDQYVKQEYFTANQNLKLYRIYLDSLVYENGKIIFRLQAGQAEFYTSSTKQNIVYKNGFVDTDEIFTKNTTKNGTTELSADSTKTRTRYVTYNTLNRCTEKANETYSFSSKTWSTASTNKIVYQNDTLLLRDTLNEPLLQTLTAYEYATCTQVVSNIQDVAKTIDFTLAPNPANGHITVSLGEENRDLEAQITLYNIQGVVVQNQKMASQSANLEVAHLPRGLYFIKITQNNQFSTKKIILN